LVYNLLLWVDWTQLGGSDFGILMGLQSDGGRAAIIGGLHGLHCHPGTQASMAKGAGDWPNTSSHAVSPRGWLGFHTA